MKTAIRLVFALLLGGAASSSAQEGGTIRGQVVYDVTGDPVDRALIRVVETGASALSDEEGVFQISGLPPGSVRLRVTRMGFAPAMLSEVPVRRDAPTVLEIRLEPHPIHLSETVVTAARVEERSDEVAANVSVLTRRDMGTRSSYDMGDALQEVPGLTIQQNGGVGSNVFPTIQGSEPRHVLVLMDGLPLNSLSEGLADLSQIPLNEIERAEIMKGTASAVWGSALGGVIHLVTRAPAEREIQAHAQMGRWNTGQYALTYGDRAGPFGVLLSASHIQTDGFAIPEAEDIRPHSDYEADHMLAKAEWVPSDRVRGWASFTYRQGDGGSFEFPGMGPQPPFWASRAYDARYGLVGLDVQPIPMLSLSLTLKGLRLDTEQSRHFEGMDPITASALDKHLGVSVQTTLRPARGRLMVGLDWDRATLQPGPSPSPQRKLTTTAVYAHHRMNLGSVGFTLGGRYDDTSEFGGEFSPSVGVLYRVFGSGVVRASAARGFTVPLLSYKYDAQPPFKLANPDIEPERAWVYQVGGEAQMGSLLWGTVTLYRADVSDAIDTRIVRVDTLDMPRPDGSVVPTPVQVVMKDNFVEQQRQGVEGELRVRFPFGLQFRAAGAFNDIRDEKTDEVIKGKPRITYDVGMAYDHAIGLTFSLTGQYIWWNERPEVGALDKKFVWDGKLSQRLGPFPWGSVTGFVAAHNLFDVRAGWSYDLYPLPGQWFEAGVTYTR